MGGNGSGGDSTTQKNIFNGNKLPENFIFPKWESPPDCFLQNGKNSTKWEEDNFDKSNLTPPQ